MTPSSVQEYFCSYKVICFRLSSSHTHKYTHHTNSHISSTTWRLEAAAVCFASQTCVASVRLQQALKTWLIITNNQAVNQEKELWLLLPLSSSIIHFDKLSETDNVCFSLTTTRNAINCSAEDNRCLNMLPSDSYANASDFIFTETGQHFIDWFLNSKFRDSAAIDYDGSGNACQAWLTIFFY